MKTIKTNPTKINRFVIECESELCDGDYYKRVHSLLQCSPSLPESGKSFFEKIIRRH